MRRLVAAVPSRLRTGLRFCRLKCRQWSLQAKQDPVYFWYRGVRNMLQCAERASCIPFEVTFDEEGRFTLSVIRGGRMLLWKIVAAILLLRVVLFYRALLNKEMWVHGDQLSPYAGVYAAFTASSFVFIGEITLLQYHSREISVFYNAFVKFHNHFAELYFGVPQMLHVYKDDRRVKVASFGMLTAGGFPLWWSMLVYNHFNTPGALPWYVADHGYALRFLFGFLEWLILVLAALMNASFFIILTEPLLNFVFITVSLRGRLRNIHWKVRRFYHIQEELLVAENARIMRIFYPLAVACGMIVIVVCNWQLTSVRRIGITSCIPCRYWILAVTSGFWILVVLGTLRLGEKLLSESELLLTDLKTAMRMRTRRISNRCSRSFDQNSSAVAGQLSQEWIYKRLPLRIQFYTFFYVRDGFEMKFIQETIENTVTLIVLARTQNMRHRLL